MRASAEESTHAFGLSQHDTRMLANARHGIAPLIETLARFNGRGANHEALRCDSIPPFAELLAATPAP